MSISPGRFITFEGGEGVGKSTNIRFVADWLSQRGIEVIVTREPGGTPIAETIRNSLLKAHHEETMTPLTELLLVFAARAQHLDMTIRPALASGAWVLCDRFTDSTIAYQGYGRSLPETTINTLKDLVQAGLEPDCTFLLDAPVTVGMGRAAARAAQTSEATDRFETEQLSFFERVRSGFLALASSEPRFRVVDATQSLDDVQIAISNELTRLMENAS